MNKIKIYCEDGLKKEHFKELKQRKNIQLVLFPFENKNKKTSKPKRPSSLTCDSTLITADSNILISDTVQSDLFDSIRKIIGAHNFNDIRHIDTAYKENCKIFITSDKGDIVNNEKALENLTGIKFFHCKDFELIENYINKLNNA